MSENITFGLYICIYVHSLKYIISIINTVFKRMQYCGSLCLKIDLIGQTAMIIKCLL